MIPCLFVTDLHGHFDRYVKLFHLIREEKPMAVFMGGDLLPHRLRPKEYEGKLIEHFMTGYLIPELIRLQEEIKSYYPAFFVIMGNDDARSEEPYFIQGEQHGLWNYIHFKKISFRGYSVIGYSYVPPTPFRLKDWERYDVSRYADPGCIHPTEGFRTVETSEDIEYSTIRKDIGKLTKGVDMSSCVCLFHSPPYKSFLDRAALDGVTVDHVPLDVHVGSIAILEFIRDKQPYLTMHGHIHESTRITGQWMQQFGQTIAFNAAWDGPELSVIKLDLESPSTAVRLII
jgi:Icc-related predicted phosphoesterase